MMKRGTKNNVNSFPHYEDNFNIESDNDYNTGNQLYENGTTGKYKASARDDKIRQWKMAENERTADISDSEILSAMNRETDDVRKMYEKTLAKEDEDEAEELKAMGSLKKRENDIVSTGSAGGEET